MLDKIIAYAKAKEKNILILGSPRSGTHALGAEFATVDPSIKNIGEICIMGESNTPWNDIEKLFATHSTTVAHLVQLLPKIHLANQIPTIKKHVIIVCLRRKDKIKQFASNYYFRKIFNGPWHNHTGEKFQIQPGHIEATQEDIRQFMQEQMFDDYFLPDFNLCYEDLIFTQRRYNKNSFPFPLEQIFSNLDYVKEHLGTWDYHDEHLK